MRDVFKFNKETQSFERADVTKMKFMDVYTGAYVFRSGMEGDWKIYFTGLDNEMEDYLLATNRLIIPMKMLLDSFINLFYRAGRNVLSVDLLEMTVEQLWKELADASRSLPEKVTFQHNPYGQTIVTQQKEKKLLADFVC